MIARTGGAHSSPALDRARRHVATMVAAAVMLGVLLASGVTWLAVVRARDASANRALSAAAEHADDVQDPPADTFLFIRDASGHVHRTPDAPAGLPVAAAMTQVGRTRHVDQREVSIAGTEYAVRTVVRDGAVVQAAQDLTGREQERQRLAGALLLALLVGLALALAAGTALARRATRPLAEALERQRRFVADASHELRTPLSRLAMRAELLTRELRPAPATGPTASDPTATGPTAAGDDHAAAARRDADLLLRDAQTMSEVLNDLLVSAQLRVNPAGGTPVDVAALVTEVVAADQVRADLADISLTAAGPSTGGEGTTVLGSPTALRRALGALVDNALAHTPPGGTVQLTTTTDGHRVRVSVRDDGEGLDPDRLEELLRPFGRGHDDRRRFGLGLALVRDVLEAHGGTLGVESSPGHGANWIISLPVRTRPPRTSRAPRPA